MQKTIDLITIESLIPQFVQHLGPVAQRTINRGFHGYANFDALLLVLLITTTT